jgi:sulfur carrier protein
MQIFINGTPREVAADTTLADLMQLLALGETACATAVNGQFVPRQQRAQTHLTQNDQVMTFEPITGG